MKKVDVNGYKFLDIPPVWHTELMLLSLSMHQPPPSSTNTPPPQTHLSTPPLCNPHAPPLDQNLPPPRPPLTALGCAAPVFLLVGSSSVLQTGQSRTQPWPGEPHTQQQAHWSGEWFEDEPGSDDGSGGLVPARSGAIALNVIAEIDLGVHWEWVVKAVFSGVCLVDWSKNISEEGGSSVWIIIGLWIVKLLFASTQNL